MTVTTVLSLLNGLIASQYSGLSKSQQSTRKHQGAFSTTRKPDFSGTRKGGYLESQRLIAEAVAVFRHMEHRSYSVSVEP
jgi:hypothetical protein